MTDDHGQRNGKSEPLMKAQAREIRRETRFGACHPEVRGQRQAQPTANGRTLDGRDDWQRLFKEPDGYVVQTFTFARSARRAFATAEVRASTEVLAFTAQHHGTAFAIIRQAFECLGQVSNQISVEEVVGRPPDFQHRNLPWLDPYPYVTPRHRIASLAGLPALRPGGQRVAPPILASPHYLANGAAVVRLLTGVAASELWQRRTGRRQEVVVDARHAAASLRSYMFAHPVGQRPPSLQDARHRARDPHRRGPRRSMGWMCCTLAHPTSRAGGRSRWRQGSESARLSST